MVSYGALWLADRQVLRGEIRATIDGSPEIVTFMDDDDYASPEQIVKLAQAHALAQSVNIDLLYSNRAMLLNKKLLTKVSCHPSLMS